MMKLAIDNGNSDIVFALYNNDNQLLHIWRCLNNPQRKKEEYAVWFTGLMQIHQLQVRDIVSVGIISVVPQTEKQLIDFCNTYLCAPYIVKSESSDFGFDIKIDTPSQVGNDRLANGVSGMALYGRPLIVTDFGTATSFDIFDHHGDFIGGLIAPGVHLSIKALSDATAQLPLIDLSIPNSLIGKNTIDAMQSGIYWGYVAMITGIIEKLKCYDELKNASLVITGGLAQFFRDALKELSPILDQELTLKGLLILMDKSC